MCRNERSAPVYITAGGSAYHRHDRCPALQQGQRRVERRGGHVAPVEPVPLSSDRLVGRYPCSECRPPERA